VGWRRLVFWRPFWIPEGAGDMPTFGSLFAGIGGIDLGLERAGWECRFQVEWDPYCQHVLAHHWPDVPRYGDITAVDWSGVERVDLLAGGFPCQPVSSAGQQAAQDDARWLWPEFLRAIRALRPRYVLVENVPGLLAVNNGSAFSDVLGDLAASGYDAEWDCIPASAVGAPHRRDRVWLVAYPSEGMRHRVSVFSGWDAQGTHQEFQRIRAIIRSRRARNGPPADFRRLHTTDGLSSRLDSLAALGNAVVPQVVEVIGRQLIQAIEAVA
jgi:DNA (cytosine-5)-methyltransferase 1